MSTSILYWSFRYPNLKRLYPEILLAKKIFVPGYLIDMMLNLLHNHVRESALKSNYAVPATSLPSFSVKILPGVVF
jgi:hypothetical protein